MEVGVEGHAPASLPQQRETCRLYGGLGGSLGLSGRLKKISPPPGFDSQTVQSVSIVHTDHSILAY